MRARCAPRTTRAAQAAAMRTRLAKSLRRSGACGVENAVVRSHTWLANAVAKAVAAARHIRLQHRAAAGHLRGAAGRSAGAAGGAARWADGSLCANQGVFVPGNARALRGAACSREPQRRRDRPPAVVRSQTAPYPRQAGQWRQARRLRPRRLQRRQRRARPPGLCRCRRSGRPLRRRALRRGEARRRRSSGLAPGRGAERVLKTLFCQPQRMGRPPWSSSRRPQPRQGSGAAARAGRSRRGAPLCRAAAAPPRLHSPLPCTRALHAGPDAGRRSCRADAGADAARALPARAHGRPTGATRFSRC